MISRSSINLFLVSTLILCSAMFAQAATFSGSVTESSATFDRPFVPFNQGDFCQLSGTGTAVHYTAFQFKLTSSTNVTISLLPADGATISPTDADTVMILYGPGGFDPANGCTNAIMASDDADDTTRLSKIVTTTPLAPGVYTLVVTTFDNEPAEPAAGPLPYVFTAFSSVPFGSVVTQHVIDFDGDGKTDYSVIRDIGGSPLPHSRWFIASNATNVVSAFDWGYVTDFDTPADFDGDHKTDIAVWRQGEAGNSFFYILQSQTNTVRIVNFGQGGDDPSVVADYDGDGKADPAVYRPGTPGSTQSIWFYLGSLNNPNNNITFVPWGQQGDFAAPGDYDGDGKNDFCIQRDGGAQGIFWLRTAAGATKVTWFGQPTDTVVTGDYDGDGKTDLAAIRGVAGGSIQWAWLSSLNNTINYRIFGLVASDFPTQGDYDGDGATDVSVWRPGSPGVFWTLRSSTNSVGAYGFGTTGDFPTAAVNKH